MADARALHSTRPTGPGPLFVFGVVTLGTLGLYLAWALWVPLLPENLYVPLLDLGKITGYTWVSALRYAALLAGLYALYWAGYCLVRAGHVGWSTIAGTAGVFACVMLFVYPATAVDVFGYAAQGHVLAFHEGNPFVTPPGAFRADPILPYLAFPGEPTQYGPAWALLSAAVVSLAGGSLLWETLLFKAVGAAAHLAGAALVLAIGKRLAPGSTAPLAGAYLYAWNPLLLWEMVGNAHNDGFMMLGVLAAIWLLVSGRFTSTFVALAVGAIVKAPAAWAAPVLGLALLRRDRWALLEGVGVAALLVFALYRPFWVGPETLTVLGRVDLLTASLASVLSYALAPTLSEPVARQVARDTSVALLVVASVPILWAAWRARTYGGVVTAAYASMLGFVLLGITWFQAWYVVWPLGLAATLPDVARHREVALLSLGAMGSYFVFIYLWVMGVLPGGTPVVQGAAYACIVGPLLLSWAWIGAARLAAGVARGASAGAQEWTS